MNNCRSYVTLACFVGSLGGLLFGFDTAVISGTVERVRQQFVLSDLMEGWFTSSALVGSIFGAACAGALGDRYGRRAALLGASMLFLLSGIYSAVPANLHILIAARLVCGLSIGVTSVIAPMYISEFAPAERRGRLVGLYQLSIVIGILLAYLSNWLVLEMSLNPAPLLARWPAFHWAVVEQCWRGMFAVEILPSIIFIALLLTAPESPRWLIQAGHIDRGMAILTRAGGRARAERELSEIKESLGRAQGSFAELFRPGVRMGLLVGIMLAVFGQLSGVNIVVYYGPKILAAAGYQTLGSLLGQAGFGLINLIATCLALLLIDKWGRRPLLIFGMGAVTCCLAGIGGLFLWGGAETGATGGSAVPAAVGLWIGILISIYIACLALSICAVIWVLTPEFFPNRLRGRGMAAATFANWFTNAVVAMVFPWFVARYSMHVFFFTTAGICFLGTWCFWKLVPETKGRTLEEIEQTWAAPDAPAKLPVQAAR